MHQLLLSLQYSPAVAVAVDGAVDSVLYQQRLVLCTFHDMRAARIMANHSVTVIIDDTFCYGTTKLIHCQVRISN